MVLANRNQGCPTETVVVQGNRFLFVDVVLRALKYTNDSRNFF